MQLVAMRIFGHHQLQNLVVMGSIMEKNEKREREKKQIREGIEMFTSRHFVDEFHEMTLDH